MHPPPKFHHPVLTRSEVIVLTNKQANEQTQTKTLQRWVKSSVLASHTGLWGNVDLHFHSCAPDISLNSWDHGTRLMYRMICLFTSQLLLLLILPTTEGWPCWVDLGGWLDMEMVYLPADSHPSQFSATALIKTDPLPVVPDHDYFVIHARHQKPAIWSFCCPSFFMYVWTVLCHAGLLRISLLIRTLAWRCWMLEMQPRLLFFRDDIDFT